MTKTIRTIMAAFAAILLIVGFKDIFSCYLPAKNRGIQTVIKSGDMDILFLGSSTFRCNIDMELVDKDYSPRSYDIAYAGNQSVATVTEYEELLSGGREYGLMVFDLNPMLLCQDVKISDARVIWDLTLPSKMKLWKAMRDSGETDLSVFYEFFVTSGMDDLLTYPITEPIYATRYYKGGKNEDVPAASKEFLENESFDIRGEKVNETQREAVAELVRRCREDGQSFVFVETPHYYRLEDDPTYKKLRQSFIDTLKAEGVTGMILAEDVEFDSHEAAWYEDMTHFSGAGRREYTKQLINILSNIEK